MSNSYFRKMRIELRKSGLDYDESDFPTRRQNIIIATGSFILIAGAIALGLLIDIEPSAPQVQVPGSNTENQVVRAVIAFIMISPLLYLLLVGVRSLVRTIVAKAVKIATFLDGWRR